MDDISTKLLDNLRYMEERSGTYKLFYLNKYTGISVVRSVEGYNHFAQWYIKIQGKTKKSFEIRDKEQALHSGYVLFIEMVSDNLLKIKG